MGGNNDNKEGHQTVLLEEGVECLNIQNGDLVVDATLGVGGHTLKILEKIGEVGVVVAIDLDKNAIDDFIKNQNVSVDSVGDGIWRCFGGRLLLVNDNFNNIKKIVKRLYLSGDLPRNKVKAVLADLGWRIEQVENDFYGMSFRKEMPLLMRMDGRQTGLTARVIINDWKLDELEVVFSELGGEPRWLAKEIAKTVVSKRKEGDIKTTLQLAKLVEEVKLRKGVRGEKIHPATKVFQALRIVVNEELSNLRIFLKEALDVLENEGRLAVISFHSLEDRLIKDFFRTKTRGCVCSKEIPVCCCGQKREVKIISAKGIKPGLAELEKNRRARTAKLRVIEKQK